MPNAPEAHVTRIDSGSLTWRRSGPGGGGEACVLEKSSDDVDGPPGLQTMAECHLFSLGGKGLVCAIGI